jgi:uncharacterized Zn-binding protein involved in type VI secretion
MPGIAVRDKDKAGGEQGKTVKHPRFRVQSANEQSAGDPVITVGDTVHGHADAPHDQTAMVEGESRFRINGDPVCRAGDKASCGHPTTGRVRFRIETANSGFPPYRIVPSPPCNVEHIPWVMRAKGWDKGLALMERWFREKASSDKSLPPDTTTVTMEWLLGFSDVSAAYDHLTDPRVWRIQNGYNSQGVWTSPIERLCAQLAERGLLTGSREIFDDLGASPQQLRSSKRQIDSKEISHAPIAGPDDLTASLAVFELFLIVAGSVEPSADGYGHIITIDKAGVFAQDDYDFNDEPGKDQKLGKWNFDELECYYDWWFWKEGCSITNDSFRDYRNLTHRGGDFEVYSNLLIKEYPLKWQFRCSAP